MSLFSFFSSFCFLFFASFLLSLKKLLFFSSFCSLPRLPLIKHEKISNSFLSQHRHNSLSFLYVTFFKNLQALLVLLLLFFFLLRESTSGVHEGDFEVMTTAADLVASAFETFFSSSGATFDVVTYRTLSRKFALTARAGKRLLWTILNAMPREEREKWTCVVCVSRERRVELKRLEEEEEGNEFEGEEDVAVYALVRKREEENVLEQLVREEEKETKMQLDSEEDVSWMLKHGAFAKSDVAKRLPRGKKFSSSGATTTKSAAEQKKPAASAATAKKPSATGPKSGNIASMFGGTGKKTVAKPKEPAVAKKKTTPKKKTPEKKKAKTPTPKKKAPAATNADAMIEHEEGDSDSDDLGGGGRGNRRLSGGKRAFVDDEEEEEEEEEEPATTPVKKMKKSDEDSEPPSPEIIDKEPEEEETPRRRSTRSTPSKAAPTPKSSSKKEKPLSKKAQKDIVKARKARMQKKVIEEMDDETGEELMRTIFVDPTTNEECNEDGTLKAK